MRIFVDTNIIMELFENRAQADSVDEVFAFCESKGWERFISVGSFYTLTFLTERMLRKQQIYQPELAEQQREIMNSLLNTFSISSIGSERLSQGVNNESFTDLEDSYQHQSALHSKCDTLLTINTHDFKNVTDIEIMNPEAFKQKILPYSVVIFCKT